MNDFIARARKALTRIHSTNDEGQYVNGLLGRTNPDSTVTFAVKGMARYKYVTLRTAQGGQTVVPARDDFGVPNSAGLPVRMKIVNVVPNSGTAQYVITGINGREDAATLPPGSGSGVPTHTHSALYYEKTEHIDSSAGVGDAGKPIVLAATGQVDPSMIDLSTVDIGAVVHAATAETTPLDADETLILDSASSFALRRITWTTLKAFLKTYFDTLYNLYVHPNHTGDVTSVADGATTIAANAVTYAKMQDIATDSLIGRDTASTGDPETILLNATLSMDGAGNLQRAALTGDVTASAGSNATVIGANKVLTAMIADAQVTLAKMANLAADTIIGRANGAGTGVPQALTATQVIAILQAGLDLRYGQLAAANTWTANQTLNSTATSGSALAITRNLTATSTDAPVVNIIQDHASDDQDALRVQQDGTGPIAEFFDGATLVFWLKDGGNIGINTTDIEAWHSSLRAIQLGGGSAIMYNATTSQSYWLDNAYYDGAWKRRTAAEANQFEQTAGRARIQYAVTGAADSTITWLAGLHVGADGVGIFNNSPAAALDVLQATLGSLVQRLSSTATNDDPTEDKLHGRVTTTNATLTTVITIPTSASYTYYVTAEYVARRTGGSSGAADNGGGGRVAEIYKTVAGTLTFQGNVEDDQSHDFGSLGLTIAESGSNILIQVTGAVNNNIVWHVFATVRRVGT